MFTRPLKLPIIITYHSTDMPGNDFWFVLAKLNSSRDLKVPTTICGPDRRIGNYRRFRAVKWLVRLRQSRREPLEACVSIDNDATEDRKANSFVCAPDRHSLAN